MKFKFLKTTADILAAATLFQGNAFAGVWPNDDGTWKYYPARVENGNGWQWIDINKDGVFECYYLGEDYTAAVNTTVDGYTLNSAGQWTVNGEAQTRTLPSWLDYSDYYSYTVEDDPLGYFLGERVIEHSYPLLQLSDQLANQRLQKAMDKCLLLIGVGDTEEMYASYGSDYQFILASDKYVSLVLELEKWVDYSKCFQTNVYLTITPEKGVLKYEDIGKDGFMEALNAAADKVFKKWLVREMGREFAEHSVAGLLIDDDMHFMLTDKGIAFTSNYNDANVFASESSFLEIVVPYADIEPYLNDYGRQLIGL